LVPATEPAVVGASGGRAGSTSASRWQAVGDPLPSFAHAPPRPNEPFAAWILPRSLEPRTGDVVVVGEVAHRLLAPCPPDDPAYDEVLTQTSALYSAPEVAQWLAMVEVWLGFRLDSPPGGEWGENGR
jgi:hypothetical protein